jgi:predicted MFS family arabinose efflux permease
MGWSWTLFSWGALIGVVGVLGSYAIGRRSRLETNRWTAYSGYVVLSMAATGLAATLDVPWLVIAFGAYVAVANFAIPVIMLSRLRQPAAHACGSADPSCDATACATCPLASAAR